MPPKDAVVIEGAVVVMSRESFRLMQDEVSRAVRERQVAIDLMDRSAYVDCICDGCPRRVPRAWVSGMCGPCWDEDCEHTDGAKGVVAERDELATQVDVVTKERDERSAKGKYLADEVAKLTGALDRLRAAMEATKENAFWLACRWNSGGTDCSFVRSVDEENALRVLAEIRARGTLEPKP